MLQSIGSFTSWHDRQSVSVAETALIFGRSAKWVRNRLTDGTLWTVARPGPIAVSTRAIAELLENKASKRAAFAGYPRLAYRNP